MAIKNCPFHFNGQLTREVKHLDELTCKTIARVIGEILQETVSLPKGTKQEEIEA